MGVLSALDDLTEDALDTTDRLSKRDEVPIVPVENDEDAVGR